MEKIRLTLVVTKKCVQGALFDRIGTARRGRCAGEEEVKRGD